MDTVLHGSMALGWMSMGEDKAITSRQLAIGSMGLCLNFAVEMANKR